MNLPAVYYSAELDVIVIKTEGLNEWGDGQLFAAVLLFGWCDVFERGNFEYIGEL